MKKICFLTAVFLFIAAINAACYQSVSKSFVRFHIIAESNSPYDQVVKINLRDHIFSLIADRLSDFSKKQETLLFLKENKEYIENAANEYLKSIGYEKKAKATVVNEYCPYKNYNSFSLPYGKYDSFKITIGNGKGKNFFCVMFPPVCVSSEMTKEVNKILETKKITYKFKLFDRE